MNDLIQAFFLALIMKSIVAALSAPIKKKWPNADLWWLIYPSWVLGGILAYAADLNLMGSLPALKSLDPQVGKFLTAVIVGGGANLLHDIFDKPSGTTLASELAGPGIMSTTVKSDSGSKPSEQDSNVSRTTASASSGSGSSQVLGNLEGQGESHG